MSTWFFTAPAFLNYVTLYLVTHLKGLVVTIILKDAFTRVPSSVLRVAHIKHGPSLKALLFRRFIYVLINYYFLIP